MTFWVKGKCTYVDDWSPKDAKKCTNNWYWNILKADETLIDAIQLTSPQNKLI